MAYEVEAGEPLGAMEDDSNTYYLEEVTIDDEEDLDTEEFAAVAEDEESEDGEDNFADALNTLKNTRAGIAQPAKMEKVLRFLFSQCASVIIEILIFAIVQIT
jgi:hypothetical protein